MSSLNGGKYDGPDLVAAGFHRLKQDPLKHNPPKIQWGAIYKTKMSDAEKIKYLEKLAAAMNHAAAIIQGERDQLGRLCEQKEAQLVALKAGIQQNNTMLQTQMAKWNAEKQEMLKAIASLNARIRELENGDNG